jgi:hypothetical protein
LSIREGNISKYQTTTVHNTFDFSSISSRGIMYRHFTFRRLAQALAIGAAATAALGAQAAGVETNAAGVKNTHCVTQLEPVAEGQKASASTDGGCFATFAEAVSVATGGAVSLPANASPGSITDADVVPSAVTLIGIDYDGRNYRGASRLWYANNAFGCFGGRAYVANMPGSFNNRLSSTRGFSGCGRNTSYDGYFQAGDWVRCFSSCTYVGGFMDNRTSSKRWSR